MGRRGKKTKHPGLYRLKDGWSVYFKVTSPQTGKAQYKRALLGEMTEAQALQELAKIKQEVADAQYGNPLTPLQLSITDYAVRWLEAKAARGKASSASTHRSYLQHYILPQLGDIYLGSLTRRDVERWVTWAESVRKSLPLKKDQVEPSGLGDYYSPASVKGWWGTLCMLLKDAAADFDLKDSTLRVSPPKPKGKKKRTRKTLNPQERAWLLAWTFVHRRHRYVEVLLLAHTGMRPGELYGMHLDQLDMGRRLITVSRAVWSKINDEPKTEAGFRVIPMTGQAHEALQEHLELRDAKDGGGNFIVFPNSNGEYRDGDSLRKPLGAASKALGLDFVVTPLVLRRTFATLGRSQENDLTLQRMMGHADLEMTDVYTETKLAQMRSVVERAARS